MLDLPYLLFWRVSYADILYAIFGGTRLQSMYGSLNEVKLMEFDLHRTEVTRRNPNVTEYLHIYSDIHFDKDWAFCGKPYMTLFATKDKPMWCWKPYRIAVGIRDNDDYDVGFEYNPTTEEEFFDVLHEIINWLHDLEMGLVLHDDYVSDIEGFFPTFTCKKEWW